MITVGVVLVQLFNGLSGLLGGYMLMRDPTGDSLGMQLEWLQSTPFADFLIPGIVLFTLNGIGNVAGSVATVTQNTRAGDIAVLFGLIMIIWITAQVFWIGYKSVLQPLYFFTGFLELLFGLALRKNRFRQPVVH